MSVPDATVRLRLDLAYDGTDFSGWAVQPGRRTVAGELSGALATLFRAPIPLVVAGRTDAGVHAAHQVAHLDAPTEGLMALAPRRGLPPETTPVDAGMTGLRRRLAGLLPPDVRVFTVRRAALGFDARFAALRRHYRYRIAVSEWGVPPLRRADVLHWRRPLDSATMHVAAMPLVGLHDFAAYCKPREGATTIRELQRLDVTAEDLDVGEGTLISVNVSADAFCHSMVRSLVGALLAVGDGRRDVDHPARVLASRVRGPHAAVAPARGLTLMAVDYPSDDQLAARVAQTQAVRSTLSGCDCAE